MWVLAVAIVLQDAVQLAQAFVDRGVILFVKPHVKIHVQPILVQIVVLRDALIVVKMFVQGVYVLQIVDIHVL